jgi:hypothetical protein
MDCGGDARVSSVLGKISTILDRHPRDFNVLAPI